MSFSHIQHNGSTINGQSIPKTTSTTTATTFNNSNSNSSSPNSSDAFVSDWPVFSDDLLWTFVATVCFVGVCLNTIVLRSVWRRRKHGGTLYLLLQLCLCDLVSLFIAAVELRYVQHLQWPFPAPTCSIYLGLESICSTATVYLLICLNLHAISTFNLARKMLGRQQSTHHHQYTSVAQAPLCDNDDYEVTIDAVATSIASATPSLPRSLIIDYSQSKKGVNVLFPSLFVWFLSVSVSIPLFVLGSVMPNEQTPLVCGVVNFDTENSQLLQHLFVAVRIVIPTACLCLTFVSVLWKLCKAQHMDRPGGLEEDVAQLLCLAAVVSVTFVIFSAQRIVGSSWFEVWTHTPFMLPKYPLLDRGWAVVLVIVHWSGSAFRPLAYLLAASAIRDEVRVTLGCGRRRKRGATDMDKSIELSCSG